MWLTDRINAWLSHRENEGVEDDLAVAEAAAAEDSEHFAAAREASANDAEARRLIAQAQAHEREVDIAESDSDPDDATERYVRTSIDRDLPAAEELAPERQ